MSGTTDARLREAERTLAKSPGDPAAWDRLALDYQRAGRRLDALETAARGLTRHPGDHHLEARLSALGAGEGPWPEDGWGPANRLCSPWPGPDEGIQRWRIRLPRRPFGRPLIDRRGRVYLRADPAGLMRVSPDGRHAELIDTDWPSEVPPLLRGGEPAALDPLLCGLSSSSERELWRVVEDPDDGRLLGLGPAQVQAISPDGELLWRAKMPQTREPSHPTLLAAGGPLIGVGLTQATNLTDTTRVWGLDRETGQFLFQHGPASSSGRNAALAVALTHDGALISQLGRELRCDDRDGRPRWKTAVDTAPAPAVGPQLLVSVDPFQGARAIDLASGADAWRAPLLKTTLPPLLDGRGYTYLLHTHPDWFACLDAEGRLRFRLDLRGLGAPGPPTLGYDRTAFFCAGNELVAVR